MSTPPLLYRLVEVSRLSGSSLRRAYGAWHPSLDRIRATVQVLHRSPTALHLYIEDVRGRVIERIA
jgi:hypothetical protein